MPTRSARSTWKPPLRRRAGRLTPQQRAALPASAFAFPRQRKAPLISAAHVRAALGRFHQVLDVSDAERDRAWRNLQRAARYYNVVVRAADWRALGRQRGR